MSILATLELTDGSWTFDVNPETPEPDLQIGFRHNGGPVPAFSDLTFGYTITVNGESGESVAYPLPGVRYIASDQTYITNNRLELSADDVVVLSVWAENAGQRSEDQVQFVVPRPEQPFASWEWVDGAWTAPVSYPSDGYHYQWDEDILNWVKIEEGL